MKRKFLNYVTKLVTVALVAGFGAWGIWYAYRIYAYEETNNAQVELYINPISCRVMGYVDKICCTDNQYVNQGDTLLLIEDREYELAYNKNLARLNRAEAELRIANKQMQSNKIQQKQYEGQVEISKIKLENCEKEYRRVKNLLDMESVTQQQYDKTEAAWLLAKKEVEIAQYNYSESQLLSEELAGRAQVKEAEVMDCTSELEKSRLALSYTVICAPYDGRIGKVDLQIGQLLQEGKVITFITNESAGKWIIANVKETQLDSYMPGKEVTVTIDAVPDRKFRGIVESTSPATGTRYSMMPPNNATGNFVRITQRVPVRIRLVDADDVTDRLKGGMNAYVKSVK